MNLYIDGKKIEPGDTITSFRDEQWKFLGLTQGDSRVYVDDGKGERLSLREFFPGVFGGQIR